MNFQNAQVGYTFPEHLTRKFHVSRLRLYVSCDNIVYWSKRQGLDPRYSFDGSTNANMNSPIRTNHFLCFPSPCSQQGVSRRLSRKEAPRPSRRSPNRMPVWLP